MTSIDTSAEELQEPTVLPRISVKHAAESIEEAWRLLAVNQDEWAWIGLHLEAVKPIAQLLLDYGYEETAGLILREWQRHEPDWSDFITEAEMQLWLDLIPTAADKAQWAESEREGEGA